MLTVNFLSRGMARSSLSAAQRTQSIAQHMMSTVASEEHTVLFESHQSLRNFILNRQSKLNALDETMLGLLRPKIEEWSASDLCGTIVGTGAGRAFCCGGDVAHVVKNATNPATRQKAISYFKREFETDYHLATLKKPYVAVMDGITLGGGVGLAANAPFRIATENTLFGMPETKIGYFPDVGASYFLSRLDGELGTYLALTSDSLRGRAVFELGCATHYIPSRRVPVLIDRLSALDKPHPSVIDQTIEEFSSERQPEEPPTPFIGAARVALDFAFGHHTVEEIIATLQSLTAHRDSVIRGFAASTLAKLEARSPTSLKIALKAIRKGKEMSLLEALDMELKIATAFCNQATPDFITGVRAVIIEKSHKEGERPDWQPASLDEVTDDLVDRFFDPTSEYLASAPKLEVPVADQLPLPQFALPTEAEIREAVVGTHESGGSTGLRLEELVSRFSRLRQGKLGVKEKVLEVARRKCGLQDNADGNVVWLKWRDRHSL